MFMDRKLKSEASDEAYHLFFNFAFDFMRMGVHRRGCIALGVEIDQLLEGLSTPKNIVRSLGLSPPYSPTKHRSK